MSIKIKTKYIQEVDVSREIPDVIDRVNAELSVIGSTTAKRFCPVDTGNLRRTIGYSNKFNQIESLRGRKKEEGNAEFGTTTGYAPYVNYGTSRQAAQPFIDPAKREVIDKLPQTGKKYGATL